jgi:hypothetical protein
MENFNFAMRRHLSKVASALPHVMPGQQYYGLNSDAAGNFREPNLALVECAREFEAGQVALEAVSNTGGVREGRVRVKVGRPGGRWPLVYYVSWHDGIRSLKPSHGIYPVLLLAKDRRHFWFAINISVTDIGFPPESSCGSSDLEAIKRAVSGLGAGRFLIPGWRQGPLPLGENLDFLPGNARGVGRRYEMASVAGLPGNIDEISEFDFLSAIKEAYRIIDSISLPSACPSPDFVFRPGHKDKRELPTGRGAPHLVSPGAAIHNHIQNRLYRRLCQEHGAPNVGSENPFGNGTKVDLVVLNPEEGKYTFYEIKVAADLRTAIRESIGQLLEYSICNCPPDKVEKLVIVTRQELDETCARWLSHLRERGLPFHHLHFPVESTGSD